MPRNATVEIQTENEAGLPVVRISSTLMKQLRAKEGDPVYVTDTRWWLGGLHSMHVVVGEPLEESDDIVEIGPDVYGMIVTHQRDGKMVKVERFY